MTSIGDQDEGPDCATPGCGDSGARWKTRHGTWTFHPYCTYCLKQHGKSGGRGHSKIPKRIVLVWDIDNCYYCGLPATEEDHVIPISSLRNMPLSLMKEIVVPSCPECNRVLSNYFSITLTERKNELRTRLRKRYKKLLASPDWSNEDLRGLDGSLRRHIIALQTKKKQVVERLEYEAPAKHYELLRDEYVQYQEWLEKLGMSFD